METLKELIEFMLIRKKYWLIPIVFISFLLGGILVVSQGTAVAPFIYTIF
jgi:hypothetical protein